MAKTPEAYLAWERDAYLNAPPGGESGRQARPRIERALAMIEAEGAHNILVVSHITYLRLLLSLLLDIPLHEARKRLDIQTAGVGVIEIQNGKGKLKGFNL
jgi:broad specificity phosphatase PhoE